MTDTPLTPDQEDDALAGEYVLGTLPLAERAAVERRAKSDPDFVARIEAWEHRLAPMNDDYLEAPAPADLLPRIEARLFPRPAQRAPGWFGWALGGLAAAVAILAFFFLPLLQPGPEFLAHLASADGATAYDATWVEGDLTVTRTAGAGAAAGQVHELWLIAPGAAPVSLGLLDTDRLTVPGPRPTAGWTLAVSLEPAGGSPTGQPTGPVLMAAEIGA